MAKHGGNVPAVLSKSEAVFLQHPLGDHQLDNLAGALADAHQAYVAPVALHRVVLDVAVAAQYLNGLVGGAGGRFAGQQLGLRRRQGVVAPGVFETN